ncbi:alpha-xenorhabdolysin family binary toxin subunit A [Pseudomonas sp. NBRC 111124]|uniref:alpha-xenorhabdolysin family binary toxin subunit A n=1 Tax=Pseudomonas sp. NBRC 111124 TaxID=1661039 RepID=UPI000AD25BF5|nr:alpha-xenorhabdolysin family binary toxin subunit A [Pseudomonas sp. NBRC 111124]
MKNGSVEDLPLLKKGDAQPEKGKSFDQLTEEERAIRVPGQIFDLRREEPAFIFSRENLRTIKRYERSVRQLPMPAEVSQNQALPVLGIDANDINVFFNNLRGHVDSWDHVEDSCKLMGAELQVFAESLLTEGVGFIASIKNLDSWDLMPEDTAVLQVLKLSDSEKKTFSEGVDTYLQHITDDITDKLNTIRHVKKLVDQFGDAITKNLEPMARSLNGKLDSHDTAEKLRSIEAELVTLDADIQQMLDQYKGLVGAAFYGLVFGPLGLVVTGGIYGAQAERIRAEKNVLLEKYTALTDQKNILMGEGITQFASLKGALKDMQFRLVEVGAATKNLEDVWLLLEAYANSSLKKVKGVSTQLELKRFVSGFQRILSPWQNILFITKEISKLFNEARQGD